MGITAQDESIDPGPTTGVVGPTTNELLSVLHPPHQPGSGKPMYVKRGPGRPRKDNSVGLGKAHKLGWSHKTKNLHHGGLPGPSLNRGLAGRKKSDGLLSTGGTNLAVSSLIGELSAINHESPPRGGNNGGGDDAAESDTSSVASSLEKLHEDFSLLPEQWPGKVCAFCNLGERSMLGQGDLLRVDIPDGFDPVAVAARLALKNKTEKDVNNDKAQKTGFSCRRQKGSGKMKRLISQSSLESMNEPVDEVCGYSEEPEYSTIFDPSTSPGYYYVHHGCSSWCDGVSANEDGITFNNLEVEVIRSLNQRCLHCGNLGAGVACKAPNCGAVFHLPCAAISGAFLDPSSKTVLCSSHLDLAVSLVGDKANCTVCDSPGKISALVLCSNCDHHYHGTCMALNLDPGIRAGWQCPACKMCQACRQQGDESKLLSCDTCDKSYHIFCLRPALSSIPKHSWKCKLCRQCTDCGARTPGSGPSSRWHANFSVCDSCYQQRNKGLACPMCGKAYRHVAQKLMLQCHKCRKYVHGTCDPAADLSTYQQKKGQHPEYEYTCKPCKTNQPGLSLPGSAPRTLSSSVKRTSEELGEDGSLLGNNTQDSLFSPDAESMQTTENSIDIVWLDKSSVSNSGDDKFNFHHQNPHQQHQQTPKDNKLLNYEAKLHKRKSISGGGGSGGGGRGKAHDRMGHYSTNSNSRRHKVSELVKKRGPKPKLRMFGSGRMHRASSDSFPKEEEGQPVGVENRMILCSSRDDFVLQQDVCVMCGAYGNDLEGRLIACAQCGQCYHPFCANVKVNRIILEKGWRCLDCTVCEGCGQRNDEARLILCDECDVSFHIYCMDPPLDSVPDGTWKCKWCVVCQYCGTNDPGRNSIWHNNYTTCGPCASYSLCPVCKGEYTDGELIIKCNKCDKWIHAGCDSIKDDDEAEKCSDENYHCVLCRPSEVPPPHLRPPPPPVTKAENPPKSPDLLRAAIASEGVYLSEEGNAFIKSLQMDLYVPRDKRDKRKKKLKKRPISEMEAGILAVIESVVSGGAVEDKSKEEKEDENEKDMEERKRQKKLGIGGFVVRNIRGPRFKDEDEFSLDQSEPGDKPKRKAQRRKVIKNKLIESFPVYLQEAFFGKPLLKPSTKETDLVVSSIDELEDSTSSFKYESTVKLTKEEIKEIEAIKAKQKSPEKAKPDNRQLLEQSVQNHHHQQQQQVVASDVTKKLSLVDEDDSEMAFQDILTGDLLDNDFMDNIMNEGDDIKVEEGLVDFRTTDDSNDFSLDQTSQDVVNSKDEFNDILTSQFGLDNIDPGLPSMDSKDVEDIFKGVLIEESQEPLFSQVNSVPAITDVASSSRVNSNQVMPPSSLPVSSPTSIPPNIATTGPVQASPGLPRATPLQTSLASPVNFPPPSPYPSEYSNSPQFSPAFSEPPSPWPAATSEGDADQPNSNNQRSLLKWEADEALGPNATIVSVLYANINHPELKRDYASWHERAKQIAKIWRNLPSDKRAPYLQKARENRAASRMQKTQQDPEKLGSGAAKSARNVETQEERQWKQMQALRQQQQGGLPVSDQHVKDGIVGVGPMGMAGASSHPPFTPSSVSPLGAPRMMPPGSPGVAPAGLEGVRQPLQSPLSPSPMGRPQFPGNLQLARPRPPNMTVAMPPPSPSGIYQPRPEGVAGGPNSPNIRGPLYARLPFQHQQPRQTMPTSMQSDVYGTPPATPQPPIDSIPQSPGGPSVLQDQYSHNSPLPQQQQGDGLDALGSSPRPSPSPQNPEAKQHLRGLLQRQQIKPDQVPGPNDVPSQNRPSWAHPVDDPTKLQTVVTADGQQIVQRFGAASKEHCFVKGEFRQPLLPSHVRVPANVAQLSPGHPAQAGQRPPPPGMTEFRLGSPGMDPRARILLQQQQRGIIIQSQQGMPQQRPTGFNQFPPGTVLPSSPSPIRSPIVDPYEHLGVQQQQQQQRMPVSVSTSPMLAQQLGRPLSAGVAVSASPSPHRSMHSSQHAAIAAAAAQSHHHQPPTPPVRAGGGKPADVAPKSVSPPASASGMGDHQELPDSVTEELEKLEQEHNSDHGVEGEPSELADLGMDDDELLGMGDDFNILEYADSELDDVVGGEKTNILDNLDLEEDEKEEGRKDETDIKDGDKKEPSITTADFASLTAKSNSSPALTKVTDSLGSHPNVSHMLSPANSSFMHAGVPGAPHRTHEEQLLRPNQHQQPPPPPYPVPPPPYPGRPQMVGIRNGGGGVGVIPNAIPSALTGLRSPLASLGGVVVGGGPPIRPPSLASPPNANTHLHLTPPQRRTLLLQEQPLLLEDLLEQEKREQQKQLPPHGPGLMGAAPEEPLLSDFDFERLKADVLSSSNLPVSLSPPNLVGNAIPPQQPGVFIRTASGQLSQVQGSAPPQHWQIEGSNQQIVGQQPHQLQGSQQQAPPPPGSGMEVSHVGLGTPMQGPPGTQMRMNIGPLPPPPHPPEHVTNEQERQQQDQYEKWLMHQKSVLEIQQKTVQTEVEKLRKQKKAINCKIRQLKKTGSQLGEQDTAEMARIVSELGVLQKQLDQVRKQTKQHTALIDEHQNKKQKKQQQQQIQMMGANPQNNSLGAQMSPLGPSSANSPLHSSTPQSPMHMSSSPGMPGGPSPSPLMQHSPMASPLTPSPGPHSATLSQTSPRVVVNPGQHGGTMDDMPFSPTNDPNMRPLMAGQMPQNIRIPVGAGQVQMRMSSASVGSPGGHQQIIVQQQPGGPNQVGNQPGIMIVRGINPNMLSMQHQQQMGRMRVMAPGQAEQMKMLAGQMGSPQRFQRVGISQEVLARVKGPQFSNSGMPMSPVGQQQQHYTTGARVPFPTQSPNAATNMNMNMRSPSPMTPVGGLGSPPSSASQTSVMQQMVQNRVSPASSPMRRPSGSGSVGAPSPMTADRPQSVENPMTPRSTAGGSRPHTPIGSNNMMQQQHGHNMDGMNVVPISHAPPGGNLDASGQFNMDVYSCAPPTPAPVSTPGGGGGGQNHQILPFPTFSWSSDVHKMGLKGGSPFSVINESVQANNNNNATSSNSVADSEVATQATTITVSTTNTELNNSSHLHEVIDGEGSSTNTASPPSSVSSATGSTTLSSATEASTNSADASSHQTPNVSNKTSDTVPVKSVLVAVSVSSSAVPLPPHPLATKSVPNASQAVSTSSPPVIATSSTTAATNTTVAAATDKNEEGRNPVTTVSSNSTIVTHPATSKASAAPVQGIPIVTSITSVVAKTTPSQVVSTSLQSNLLTKNSVQAAVAAVVSTPGMLLNSLKEPIREQPTIAPPSQPVVIVSSVQAMVNSIAKVVNAVAASSNSSSPPTSSGAPSTPSLAVIAASPANSHSGATIATLKTNPVSTSSAFIVASTSQMATSYVISPAVQQQTIVRPNVTSVSLRPQVTTLTLSSVMTPTTGNPVTAIKSAPIIPVTVAGVSQQQQQQQQQQHQPSVSIPTSAVQISLAQQTSLPPPPPVVQHVSLAQSLPPTQLKQQQQQPPALPASAVPSVASLNSAVVSAVSTSLAGITSVVRQPVIRPVLSSGTVASAVTFVPPAVTVPQSGTGTGPIPSTSMPPASYISSVPAPVTVVPSAAKPQPTPVAVGFASVPFSTFQGAQQVHISSSAHGQPPTSATVIYTTHHINASGGVRVATPVSHPTSLQIPHQIPLQIHQQQQPGGTIVHHALPVGASSHGGGAGTTVVINDTSGGTPLGNLGTLASIVQPATISVPSSSQGAPVQTVQAVATQQGGQQQQSQGESQNALLKQLLQNTGCASMTQTSENVGFSLTSCLSRPTTTSHTSHLSKAATQIPNPTPVLRPATPTTPGQSAPTAAQMQPVPTPAQLQNAAAITQIQTISAVPQLQNAPAAPHQQPQSAPAGSQPVQTAVSAVSQQLQNVPTVAHLQNVSAVSQFQSVSTGTPVSQLQTVAQTVAPQAVLALAQGVPTLSVHAQNVPVQSIPPQSVSVQNAPPQTVPAQSVPVQSIPVQSIPVQNISVQNIPVQNIPVQNIPLQNIPVQSIPVQSMPVQSIPVQSMPVQNIPAQIPLTRPTIKTEPTHTEAECSQSNAPVPVVETVSADIKPQIQDTPESNLGASEEAIIAVVQEAAQTMMQNHDSKLNDIISGVAAGAGEIPSVGCTPASSSSNSAISTTAGSKKGADEDAKKLKRRQYAAKRKQSMANNKESPTSKKRPRKVGRPEDDFDNFLENFMTQLRQLSPIGIVEPELSYSFNVCALIGVGEFSKLAQKNYSTFWGDLTGHIGKANLASKSDFYNTRPFGPEPPKPQPKPQPTHRGFYYQEFATPKLGTFEEKIRSDNRTPSPVRETSTPDTIVSASSPECTAWDNMTMYPGLKYIDEDMNKDLERCISPEMPLLAPIPIRPSPIDPKSKQELLLAKEANIKDMDKENKQICFTKDGWTDPEAKLRSGTPLKDTGNITVTLTVSSAAAEDIRGLLRNLANVLSIAAPTYQVIDKGGSGSSSASSIVSEQKSHLYTIKGKDGKEKIDIQSILNGAAKFCRHCDVVVLNHVIKKKVTDFPGIGTFQLKGGESVDSDFCFCSTNCLMQFSITHGVPIPHEEKAAAIVTHPGGDRLKTIKSENDGGLKVKNKINSGESDVRGGKVKVKEESAGDAPKPEKRWKGTRYRTWGRAFLPPTRYKKPTDKEITELLFRKGITATPSKMPLDTRECIFCHLQGDGVSDGPGRLLNFDVDKWVHLNCALWSDDVYETENGALVNVELALKQSLTLFCVFCNRKGATVKCFKTRCSAVYHLGCATKEGCMFYKNKTIYCPAHVPKGEKENELATLSVYRRVYIQRDENKQVAAVMHHADQHHLLRVGSLIFLNVGQLLPHQLQAFHTPNFIYPIGYKIARFYWSMRKVNKRCQYICSIHDVDGKPEFRITAQEEGFKEHVVKASTAQGAWSQILEAISRLRNCAEIIRVFPKYITGEDLFGLTEPSIVKVLESLPGIETLTDYHFKYGRNPLLELPLAINPTGCARSEPKLRTHFKRPQTQRTRPSRSTLSTSTVMSSEAACPYSKQFVHSKSSQYKKMKQEWRNNVYLARSKIQGLGLYAARDIEKHTMVIEYIGEIIRPELAELREKKYEAQNRGIYMFRLDENRVIDATLCGGLARYINHSCNPNCVAETVEVDRDLRIIIFANRRISRGEELSYDYKFEVEDDQHKIPCLCGAPNCQQWMN